MGDLLSSAEGIILVSVISLSGIRVARAREAAAFMFSVIREARQSRAPRKMPGNASRLFIWLGKSERPVPTIRAPPASASSGMISGVGFAIGMTIASFAIPATISRVTIPGAETPINTSAPRMASARVPLSSPRLVIFAISAAAGFSLSSPSQTIPRLLHMMIFPASAPRFIR